MRLEHCLRMFWLGGPVIAVVSWLSIGGCRPASERAALGRVQMAATDHGLAWTEKQELTTEQDASLFGSVVAIADDLIVVGAPDEVTVAQDGSSTQHGAAYVFEKAGQSFALRQRLAPQASDGWNDFGSALAIANASIFVSAKAQGTSRVFTLQNKLWIEQQTLDTQDGTALGGAVAALGDTAVVTSPNTFVAHVFERSADGWSETAPLTPDFPDTSPPLEFGASAAIADDAIVIGAPGAFVDGSSRGAAYAFRHDAMGAWQQQQLFADDGQENDRFGDAVAIVGGTAFIGAPYATSDPTLTKGAVYVFEWNGSQFAQVQKLMRETPNRADSFGSVLAASEGLLLVGIPSAGAGPSGTQGVVEAFVPAAAGWAREQTFSTSDGLFDGFGAAIAVAGTRTVVGAPYRRTQQSLYRGAAYVEELLGSDGATCNAPDACVSGHCESGTCCERECGPCGTCDTGVCASRAPGSEGAPSCAPYVCDGSSVACLQACRTSGDCATSYFCDAGACVERRPNGATCRTAVQCLSDQCIDRLCLGSRALGEPCSESVQCGSGYCVDEKCCDGPCDGQCQACDVRATPGRCSVVSGRPHGNREACRGEGTECSGLCDGSDPATCAYPPAAAACGSFCANAELIEKSCDGNGACIESEPRPCENNLACEGDLVCKRSCTSNADCRARFTCDVGTGECVPRAVCADSTTSLGADGSKADCAPYICEDGSCKTRCETKDDCASPLVCDGEHCVPGPAPGPPRTEGCNLARPLGRGSESAWPGMLFALWLARRRSWSRAGSRRRRGPLLRSPGARLKAKVWGAAFVLGLMVRTTPVMGNELRWVEEQELVREVTVPGERFGAAIALSKGTLVVGTPDYSGSPTARGSVDIFVDKNAHFELQATLTRPDADQTFGAAVAISQDTVLVGAPGPYPAPGAVYVFERDGVSWSWKKTLVAHDSQGSFGRALALDGDTAVIGQAPGWLIPAFVFTRQAGEWLDPPQLLVHDSDNATAFGTSVAISEDTIAVGDPMDDGSSGTVCVFSRSGDTWTPPQVLKASRNINSQALGSAVAIQGDVIVAGAPFGWGSVGQYAAGSAFLFERSDGMWTESESAMLGASNGSDSVHFGLAVAISSERVMVGTERGVAYTYARNGSSWAETEQELRPGDLAQKFGSSVAIDADTAAAATPQRSPENASGAVYIERLRIPNGGACDDPASCQNEACVSGVCCDRACGPCGTCATGLCKEFPRGGNGVGCEPYLCDGASSDCPEGCSSGDDCAPLHYCLAGKCAEQRPNGSECSDANDCASGNCGDSRRCLGTVVGGQQCRTDFECLAGYCVDGTCCDGACAGQCEACDVKGSVGRCTGVSGAPHGGRTPCGDDGSVCAGYCDPAEHGACSYPSGSTTCGSSCAAARETPLSCDGLGHCAAGQERSCENLECADDAHCKSRCESDRDCVAGYACQVDGSCGPAAYCIGNTSFAADGTSQACGRYACDTTGLCKTACVVKSDCVEPYVCAADGQCLEPAPVRADDAGCSCRAAPRRANWGLGWPAFLLVALVLARRRMGPTLARPSRA